MKDEDRDERGDREAGAGAPASPAAGSSPPVGHPAFHTGVVHVEPDLRDEVETYWKAYAAWERTRQGPPPRAPSVSVRVDHEGKPTEAAGLRHAVAKKDAAKRGAGEKSAGEKSAGGSPWATDEAAAAVIDKSALPSANRPRSEAAEKKDEAAARPGKARRAGTAVAVLALAAGIGAAAMCGAKERAPAEGAAARGATSDPAASGARAMSKPAASGARTTSGAAASDDSAPAPVAERAPVEAPPEGSVERAAPGVAPVEIEAVRDARRRPIRETHAPAPRAPEAQPPKRQPSPQEEPEALVAPAAPAPAPLPTPAAGGNEPPPTSEPPVLQPKLKY